MLSKLLALLLTLPLMLAPAARPGAETDSPLGYAVSAALTAQKEENDDLYSLTEDGRKVYHSRADLYQKPYTPEECRAEAERLLAVPFTVTAVQTPEKGLNETVITLESKSLPFPVHVTSGWTAYTDDYGWSTLARPKTVLYAHARCDYYEQMMAYKRAGADALAAEYGLVIEREGQNEYVTVTGYGQLESVIDYLTAANDLYDFRMDEGFMANSLSDIRTRPALIPCLPSEEGRLPVLTLYYVINHDRYPYVKTALLPALQEKYIAALDDAGRTDPAVTEEIRAERVKPALSRLTVNGEPLEAKEMDGFTLDPNVVFTYNWLAKSYTGDIRLCFPAADYDAPPSVIGDDRNFRYLVELLGGRYESRLDDSLLPDYYTAEWELGGNIYGAGSFLQSYIPTMSAFSKNGVGISLDFSYSKDMWGLEDGYSTDDFFLRVTPEALASLLGVTAEADPASGTLNLITPEGYFDQPLTAEEPHDWPERFRVESILSENGLAVKNNRYIIFGADGKTLEDAVTADYTYAELTMVSESAVMVHISGAGSVNRTLFYDTDTGAVSKTYNAGYLLKYPCVAYSPQYSGKVVIANALTGAEAVLLEDGYRDDPQCLRSARLLPAGDLIQLTYTRPDALGWPQTAEETVPAVWPE